MELREWIRKAREKSGLNQTDFGDQLGVVKQAISHWENGRNECSVTQFLRIARVAKMNPAELDDWPADLDVLDRAADLDDVGGNQMTGWPLSPELLAALQNADPKTRKRAEVALMNALDIELVPAQGLMQETPGGAA